MLRGAALLLLSVLLTTPAGAAELGARLELPSGPKSDGEPGLGSWGVLTPWGSTRFGEAKSLEAWVELPILMFSPTNAGADTFGGVRLGGRYPVAAAVGVSLEVGYMKPGYLHVSPYQLPTFLFHGEMSPGVALGMWWTASSGAARLRVAPEVVVQKNSDRVVIDAAMMTGRDIAAASANLDVRGTYRMSKHTELSLLTGAWLGNNLGTSANEGMSVPAVLDLEYASGTGTVYGLRAGISNALPPSGVGVGQTAYAGLFFRYDFVAAAAATPPEPSDEDEPASRKKPRADDEEDEAPPADNEDPIFE